MNTVSIHDAKTNLSKYIAAAKKGEQIYIGAFGKAEVVITKIPYPKGRVNNMRNFSIAKNKIIDKGEAFSVKIDQKINSLMYQE